MYKSVRQAIGIPSPRAIRGQTYRIMFVLGDQIGLVPCGLACMLTRRSASVDGLKHPPCALDLEAVVRTLKFLEKGNGFANDS